jgi:hypothetical protein
MGIKKFFHPGAVLCSLEMLGAAGFYYLQSTYQLPTGQYLVAMLIGGAWITVRIFTVAGRWIGHTKID